MGRETRQLPLQSHDLLQFRRRVDTTLTDRQLVPAHRNSTRAWGNCRKSRDGWGGRRVNRHSCRMISCRFTRSHALQQKPGHVDEGWTPLHPTVTAPVP